jgi:VWFA-related protein
VRSSNHYSFEYLLLLAAIFMLVGFGSHRQAASPSSNQTESQAVAPQAGPTFHAATRVVTMSVIVKDKRGNPVRDLAAPELEIRDNGKPQPLQFFRVVNSETIPETIRSLAPDTYTNRPEDFGGVPPSVTMILLDSLNTQLADQAFARKQVIRFLQQIRPQDHVAIYVLGSSLLQIHDFTTDSSALVAAVNKSHQESSANLDIHTPQAAFGGSGIEDLLAAAMHWQTDYYITQRVNMTVDALTQIAAHTSPLPGRKNLVWVSGSFPISIGFNNADAILKSVKDPTSEQILFASDVEKAARALNDANIAVYPVDARGLMAPNMGTGKSSAAMSTPIMKGPNTAGGSMGNPAAGSGRSRPPVPSGPSSGPKSSIQNPDQSNIDTMKTLAERTGGRAFYDTNDVFNAVHDAVDDSLLTYEIGYYPQDVKWDGSFHAVEIKVKRQGVVVRTRKGYFALPEAQITQEARKDAVHFAASSTIDPAEIGLVVWASSSDVTGIRRLELRIKLDAHTLDFEPKDEKMTAGIDSLLVQRDAAGTVLSGLEDNFTLNVTNERYREFLAGGIGYSKDLTVDPKSTEVLIIARDPATNRVGAVHISLAKYFPPTPAAVK